MMQRMIMSSILQTVTNVHYFVIRVAINLIGSVRWDNGKLYLNASQFW